MSKKLQLSIPTPCHENWDAMSPVEKGKFCGSCQKQVLDFSNMSDRQVAEFFKKPSTGSVCGRFMSDQLDRTIEIPKKRMPWVKYFFQIAIPAFMVSIKLSAQKTPGQTRVNKVASVDTAKRPIQEFRTMGIVARPIDEVKGDIKIEKIDTTVVPVTEPICQQEVMGKVAWPVEQRVDTIRIRGKIIDQYGDPLPFATIMIKNTRVAVAADANGAFTIKPGIRNSQVILVGSYVGCEMTELVVDRNGYSGSVIIRMKRSEPPFLVGELVVCRNPEIKKETKDVLLMPAIIKDATTGSFKLFPNPAEAGSTITIEWKQTEEGYFNLQFLDLLGKQVNSQEIWIDTEARMLDIVLPQVTAGTYFLVLTNKKTGKKFTEKIIIQ